MVYQLIQRNCFKDLFLLFLKTFNCSQQRHAEGMPIISTNPSFNNRHRQSIQENFGIQLPLIETNRPRVIILVYFFSSTVHIILFI
jgi:hypothetical protein